MAYSIEIKNRVVKERMNGRSLNELHDKFGVAKGTLSEWLRNVELNNKAKRRLIKKIKLGRFKSAENKKAKTRAIENKYLEIARDEITNNPNYRKIICSVMYWCEGTKKAKSGLTFTNSDPVLVKKFLNLLRSSFTIDETKFHPCIHLHDYHSPKKQLEFWSKVTNIDKKQFIKPYNKPHTKKRKREDYQGCISIKYHDNDMARQVMAVAKAYLGV